MTQTNADNLNDVMEFDHVIYVAEDGTVTEPDGVYAPTVTDHPDQDLPDVDGPGWVLLRGYSGQDRYSGPVMHPSEFIGGRMARDILSDPGFYAAVVVEDADDPDSSAGWAVAYRPPTAEEYR